MPDDPRHPHLSKGYEHTADTAARPTAAPPVEAPQGEAPDDKPVRKPRAKKADA